MVPLNIYVSHHLDPTFMYLRLGAWNARLDSSVLELTAVFSLIKAPMMMTSL